MKLIHISFTSDGLRLKGTLHMPDTHLPAVVIGSHGLLTTAIPPSRLPWPGNAMPTASPISDSTIAAAAGATVFLRKSPL